MNLVPTSGMTIQDGGWLQTHIITAHVAAGSLLLATSLATALYAHRFAPVSTSLQTVASRKLEAAV